ncbi:MAG: PRC-barrel domain-containing protein [Asgard group archaeon]|nr:PRC-barrel domain-containing protein [Asgard group archaeon]
MSVCDVEYHFNMKDLTRKKVLDKDGKDLGYIKDVILDENFQLHSFIIGGGIFEEFLEAINLKLDKNPIIKLSDIKEIGDNVVLNTAKKNLKTKLEAAEIPVDGFYFNKLKGRKVLDINKKNIGQIIGLIFLPCLDVAFLVGGNALTEIGKAIGIAEEWDLLLPTHDIKNILKDKIIANVKESDLEAVLKKKILSVQEAKSYLDAQNVERKVSIQALAAPHTT